jgi:hypothetical protein
MENKIKEIEFKSKKHGSFKVMIDMEYLELLKKHNWYVNKYKNGFYIISHFIQNNKRTLIMLHREIMKCTLGDGLIVDHINNNTLDNRKENLRLVTKLQNNQNRSTSKNSTSKYLGVFYHKIAKKWGACIKINKKAKHLGLFINEIDAAKAYNEAAKNNHKEYANLNIIK